MIQDPGLTPRPLPSTADVRQALAEVLADSQLQRALQPPERGVLAWLGEVSTQVRAWFVDAVQWLLKLRVDSPGLFWLLFAVMIGVAGLLLVHIGWTLAQVARGPRDDADVGAAPDAGRAAHSRALRAQAHALAQRGELRDGVRHLLLALLALVEERKLLAVATSWTIREIAARLGQALPALQAAPDGATAEITLFHGLTARVENACYGGASVSAADFAEVDRGLDVLLQLAAPAPATHAA